MQSGDPPRPAFGGVGPVRAWRRPVRDRHRHRPVRRAARARPVPTSSCTPAPSTQRADDLPPPSGRVDVRITEVNRILGTGIAADDLPGAARPDRLHASAGSGDVRTRRAAVVAARLDRGDRRRRGGRPPLRLRPHRQDGAEVDRARRADASASSAVDWLREVLLGLGISEAMPNPFLAPDTLRTGRSRRAALSRSRNPLVAEESVLRTSLRPGLLQAIAFNESHRRTGVRLFEIGHVYPPGDGELPDEYEALCVVLAGRGGAGGDGGWREISAALGVGARIDQGRVPAGLHADALGDAAGGQRPDRRGRRGRSGGARRFDVAERVAILELDLDQLLDREPKPTPWKPTSRLPVERPRPRLRAARRRARGAARQGDPPGSGRRCSSTSTLFDVYRGDRRRRGTPQPRLPAAPAGDRPQPHRRRRRRRAPRVSRRRPRSSAPSCEADLQADE